MQEFLLNTGAIVYEKELRLAYPNIIFPLELSSIDLSIIGARKVVDSESPSCLSSQELIRDGYVFIGGVPTKNWKTVDLNSQEIANKLEDIRTKSLVKINADDNRIYADVIGNKSTEYTRAEAAATIWKSVNYQGQAPEPVQSWADAKNKTARWACDDILNQATLWLQASDLIRRNRLKAKEAVRAANTIDEVRLAMAHWDAFVVSIRTQLGVN